MTGGQQRVSPFLEQVAAVVATSIVVVAQDQIVLCRHAAQ